MTNNSDLPVHKLLAEIARLTAENNALKERATDAATAPPDLSNKTKAIESPFTTPIFNYSLGLLGKINPTKRHDNKASPATVAATLNQQQQQQQHSLSAGTTLTNVLDKMLALKLKANDLGMDDGEVQNKLFVQNVSRNSKK